MENIELKVRIDDVRSLTKSLRELGCRFVETLKQKDTYYFCHTGRLKIREINGKEFWLIDYIRPDTASHKVSDFRLLEISKPQCSILKKMLALSLGTKTTVIKERKLWMYKNTRIHIDKVKNLGTFLELETNVGTNKSFATKEYEYLIDRLSLNRLSKIENSYSDLISSKTI